MGFIQANNVVKQFSNHLALNKVNLDVPENTIYGLLGPNGAGKTTLIRIINQITAPDSGEVLFNNRPLHPDDVAQIGYLPEERGLYKKMQVGEQCLYLAQLKGLSRHEALKRLKFWFEKFEIQAWWDKKVEELSKGMQQKVQFVTTVLHEPKLLIFDEPFSGFDPINANLLKNEILELKRNGATILFSTHNMASVEELCDHITLINRGQSILEGQVHQVKQTYKQNLVKIDFKGDLNAINAIIPVGSRVKESGLVNGYQQATIQLGEGVSLNQLIGALLGSVEIHGVQELLPSMNDIFISLVQESNSHNSLLS
jgi:ABC-2 type transport system ATP-binding protein